MDSVSSSLSALRPPLRFAVFDAVGTVIFADPPVHMAYHRIGRRFGSAITPEKARHRFREAMEQGAPAAGPPWRTSEDAEREFWRRTVESVLPDVTQPADCFAALFDHFATPTSWGCYVDVADAFQALRRRGIEVALASNFDTRLHQVCEGHPELAGVRTRLISSEIGWKKPSPQFFAEVIRVCGVSPHEILMIGDDTANDIEPARAAGMQALHLDRSGRDPDSAISNLEQLLERLPPS